MAMQVHDSNLPYVVAIVCCCLGSIAFATLFVFMFYRLRRRHHRTRCKKLQKHQPIEHGKHSSQFVLANSNFFPPPVSGVFAAISSATIAPDATVPQAQPNAFQYNHLNKTPSASFGHQVTLNRSDANATFGSFTSPNSALATPLLSPHNFGSLALQHPEGISTSGFPPFATGLDQESLLKLQLLQHGMTSGSNLSSLGALTLARRGASDVTGLSSYPFVSFRPGGVLNLSLSNATPSQGMSINANTPASFSFCPPPPPDQPLPPLPPPSTSPDSTQRSTLSEHPSGGLLFGASLSSVAPYAASFPMHSFSPDTGLLFSLDGSMPEYASASLFSGNGIIQPNLGPSGPSVTVHSKPPHIDFDGNKTRVAGETYCIPHQNNTHPHLGVWSPCSALHSSNMKSGIPTVGPLASRSTTNGTHSDAQTGSLDSSGMYYLTNPEESNPLDVSKLPVPDCNFQSHTMFFPFSSSTHMVPIHNMALVPRQQSEIGNDDRVHQLDMNEQQLLMLQCNGAVAPQPYTMNCFPTSLNNSKDSNGHLISNNPVVSYRPPISQCHKLVTDSVIET